jgi:hypothetical protein
MQETEHAAVRLMKKVTGSAAANLVSLIGLSVLSFLFVASMAYVFMGPSSIG